MDISKTHLEGKRVFISGGAGVIGLEIVPRLLALGAIVMVGDLKPRPKDFPANVIYRQGDLNQLTEQEFNGFSPEFFFHLAATFERSSESYAFWDENFLHNVRLSHHLMTIVKNSLSSCRIVFASSYLIYNPSLYQFNTPQKKPVLLKETDSISPRNLTGMAKLFHEMEMRFLDQFCADKLSIVCVRIFRGYGRNSRDIISRWVRDLLRDTSITLYNPEGIFDYIYAADSAEGLIRAATSPAKGVINLGTGRSQKVLDVINALKKHFPKMKVDYVESGLPYEASQADMTSYQDVIGWLPTYNLNEAISEIITYERNKLNDAPLRERKKLKVLVSSSSEKVPLIRAMQTAVKKVDLDGLVIAGDINKQSITSLIADDFWVMPATNDHFFEDLINGLRKHKISIIFPTRDSELLFWAHHAKRLNGEGINVVVSESESIYRCLDKLDFYHFGHSNNLPFIPTSTEISDIPGDSFVVKERFGAGSRSIGINLNLREAVKHAKTLDKPIFQPFISGLEFSVDAWLSNQNTVKGLVLRYRNKVKNGESQITTTFSNNQLETQAKKILEALRLQGPVVLQAIQSKDGNMHVIECNARFGGASTTGIKAGVDSLYWSILETQGISTDDYPFLRIKNEIQQVRLPTDIYINDPDI